jgi:DNA-binding transcriptional MerR regulator
LVEAAFFFNGAATMPGPVGFPIGFVSRRSGLSTHVIRAWERRYHAVAPHRSASGRRLFSQSDIDRLVLLRRATQNGHSISHIAGLDRAELAELAEINPDDPAHTDVKTPTETTPAVIIGHSLKAVATLDGKALQGILRQAAAAFSRQALLDQIFCPFMEQVGRRWSEGSLRIVHGQLAAVVIHAQLVRLLSHPTGGPAEKPCLLIATPAGQCCYLGALAVAITAQDHGWQPVFVGFNLPAEEIAAAGSMLGPQMIALSITCRVDDAFMHDELIRLSDLMKKKCPLVVGGRASHNYRRSIEAAGGENCPTAAALVSRLE